MDNDDLDVGDDNVIDDWDSLVECIVRDMSDMGTQEEVFVDITDDEGLDLLGITDMVEGE